MIRALCDMGLFRWGRMGQTNCGGVVVRRVTVSLSDAGRYKNKKVNSELLTFLMSG